MSVKMAKWWLPSNAKLLIEHTADCAKQKYDYVWEDDVSPEDISWFDNKRMKKAQKHLRKFTKSNNEMLVEISTTGRVVDYYPVPEDSLLEERGYARDETDTENYTMVIEGYVDPIRINPDEEIDTIEFVKSADAYKSIHNEQMNTLFSSLPSAGGLNLGGMSTKKLIGVGLLVVLGIGYMSQFM